MGSAIVRHLARQLQRRGRPLERQKQNYADLLRLQIERLQRGVCARDQYVALRAFTK